MAVVYREFPQIQPLEVHMYILLQALEVYMALLLQVLRLVEVPRCVVASSVSADTMHYNQGSDLLGCICTPEECMCRAYDQVQSQQAQVQGQEQGRRQKNQVQRQNQVQR